MSDLPPESRPASPSDPDGDPARTRPPSTSAADSGGPETPPEASASRRGLRSQYDALRRRAWSFRSVIAVGLASLIVGGLGGAALGSVSDNDEDGRNGRDGRGGPGRGWHDRGPDGDSDRDSDRDRDQRDGGDDPAR